MILWNQEHWTHLIYICLREKKKFILSRIFPYMSCLTGINLWGNSSVLLNCRFYGPVATLILENLLEDCFLATEWERPFQLMQDYQKHV